METTHYHVNGVCREHGAAPLFVFDTLEETLELFATKMDGKLETKYRSVEYGEFTTRYFEANVVDRNGNAHELFFAYGTHISENTASDCREQMEAMRAMEEMVAMLEALQRGEQPPTNPFPSLTDEESSLPAPDDSFFADLNKFLNSEQQGG